MPAFASAFAGSSVSVSLNATTAPPKSPEAMRVRPFARLDAARFAPSSGSMALDGALVGRRLALRESEQVLAAGPAALGDLFEVMPCLAVVGGECQCLVQTPFGFVEIVGLERGHTLDDRQLDLVQIRSPLGLDL